MYAIVIEVINVHYMYEALPVGCYSRKVLEDCQNWLNSIRDDITFCH